MRLTVLQQQTKTLWAEQPEVGEEIAKQLESVKHLLWHGNAEETLERLGGLIIELDLLRAFSPAADKLGQGIGEFDTYIGNNQEFIPNFGERYRQGETISTEKLSPLLPDRELRFPSIQDKSSDPLLLGCNPAWKKSDGSL